ncbi:MAG: hypothetical protein ACRDR6_17150 [Pseudonocardiaceae bacterium]
MTPGRAGVTRYERGGTPDALLPVAPPGRVPLLRSRDDRRELVEWYLRSAGHADAHYGRMTGDGTVSARCGVSFRPESPLFGEGHAVLPRPVDPVQCCPNCRAAGEAGDADGAAVAGLIDTLGASRSRRASKIGSPR